MSGHWIHQQPYYRCSLPAEYGTAKQLDHPATVNLREADLLPHLDAWIARLFAPDHLEATLEALVAAGHDPDRGVQEELRRLEQVLADCQRQLARFRATLDAGGDPVTVTAWINQARRAHRCPRPTRPAVRHQTHRGDQGTAAEDPQRLQQPAQPA